MLSRGQHCRPAFTLGLAESKPCKTLFDAQDHASLATRLASRPYLSESSRFRFYLLIALLVHVDVQGVHTSDQGCRYLKQEQAHQSKYCSNRNPRSNMAGTSIFDRVTHDCIQHDAFEPWMCWDFWLANRSLARKYAPALSSVQGAKASCVPGPLDSHFCKHYPTPRAHTPHTTTWAHTLIKVSNETFRSICG